MLPAEEFSCQSSMEHTCGQYCSSQSMGETNAWGGWNYLCLDVEDIGPFGSPPQFRRGGRWGNERRGGATPIFNKRHSSFFPRTRVFDTKRLNDDSGGIPQTTSVPLGGTSAPDRRRRVRKTSNLYPKTADRALMRLSTVAQDHAEETAVDCQSAAVAVIDKAQLPELIHEMTDPRPGSADHLGQVILTHSGNDRF